MLNINIICTHSESNQETGLAHSSVTDNENFKQVVAVKDNKLSSQPCMVSFVYARCMHVNWFTLYCAKGIGKNTPIFFKKKSIVF